MKTTSLLFSSVLSNELFWNLGREKFGKKVDDILAMKKDQFSRNILKDLEIEGKNLHQNELMNKFRATGDTRRMKKFGGRPVIKLMVVIFKNNVQMFRSELLIKIENIGQLFRQVKL